MQLVANLQDMHMNRSYLFSLGALVLAVMLVGVGGEIAAGAASGRYPRSQEVGSEHVSLGPLQRPSLSTDSEFLTDDALTTVALWYAGRYHIPFDPNFQAHGQCVRLAKINDTFGFRQLVVVSLCPYGRGTEVSIYQTLERVVAAGWAGQKE